jgi:hypothetical protein
MRMSIAVILIMTCLPAAYKGISSNVEVREGQCGINPKSKRILKGGINASTGEVGHWVHLQGIYPVLGRNQMRINYVDEITKEGYHHIKAAYTYNHGDQWASLDSRDSQYTNIPNLKSFYDSGVSSVADSNVLYRPSYKENSEYEVSKDGGQTWAKISWKFENMESLGSITTMIVATGTNHAGRMYLRVLERRRYALYVTDDYGKSFRFLNDDLIYITESRAKPTTLYGIKNNNGETSLCKSNDSGNNWTNIEDGGIFSKNYYDPKIDSVIGDVFSKPTTQYPLVKSYPIQYQIETDPQNPDIFYVLAINGLFKSVDGGISFTLLPLESDFYLQIDRITVDPNMPGRIYAGSGQHSIWMSENSGCSWKKLPLPEFLKWKRE